MWGPSTKPEPDERPCDARPGGCWCGNEWASLPQSVTTFGSRAAMISTNWVMFSSLKPALWHHAHPKAPTNHPDAPRRQRKATHASFMKLTIRTQPNGG